MKIPFKKDATNGELYGPAMKIQDEAAAQEHFERLVEFGMSWGQTREEAERIQRANLGYYAGYHGHETRERVERLFACKHPVFGAIAEQGAPSPEAAFEAGVRRGQTS
jgi:hypothetical protein